MLQGNVQLIQVPFYDSPTVTATSDKSAMEQYNRYRRGSCNDGREEAYP